MFRPGAYQGARISRIYYLLDPEFIGCTDGILQIHVLRFEPCVYLVAIFPRPF
jgi:hypothetical protein